MKDKVNIATLKVLFVAALISCIYSPITFAGAKCCNDDEVKKQPRQLFIDDYMVERIEGLDYVVNKAEKYPGNPVITPDRPWENRCEVYGTALFDEKKQIFRMWYLAILIMLI